MKITDEKWEFGKTTDEIFVKVEGKGVICEVFGETEEEAIAYAELIAGTPKLNKRNKQLLTALRSAKKIIKELFIEKEPLNTDYYWTGFTQASRMQRINKAIKDEKI